MAQIKILNTHMIFWHLRVKSENLNKIMIIRKLKWKVIFELSKLKIEINFIFN